MIRYIFLILLILKSSFSLAAVQIEIGLAKNKVKQGSLESAVIKLNEDDAQNFSVQKLKGQTVGEVLYLHNISSLIKRSGGSSYEADATIVFLKVPQSNTVSQKVDNIDLSIKWSEVEVVPTEPGQGMLFGQFEVPSRAKIAMWILIGLGSLVFVFFGLSLKKKLKTKNELKEKRSKLKEEITSGNGYDDVVMVWKKKTFYLQEFPHIEESLKNLEIVLFKYQFKSQQSETEKAEVMKAYREFVANIQGGFNGI